MALSGLVDRTCLRVWSMWPISVAGNLGRYLLTTSVVRPGHDCKKTLFIALSHVEVDGLNAAA